MNFNMDDFAKIRRASGLYTRSEMDDYEKFCRFSDFLDPYETVTHTREYVFFTKPDLHLFDGGNPDSLNPELASSAYFREMHDRYNKILKQLQMSTKGNPSPFMNLLTNAANSGLDLPSLDTLEMETSTNVYGESIQYRWMSLDTNHDFSVEFLDNKYLEVYLLAKTVEEYSRLKSVGLVTPPNDSYIINKILHDQSAAYKFIVGDDGETLLYYAKLYGVYIKNVPRDIFSNFDPKEGLISLSLSFNADFVEDMNPSILVDFNELTSNYYKSSPTIPIYDIQNGIVNGDFVHMPFIEYVPRTETSINPYSYYKLKWR